MRKRFSVLAAFFTSLCAACAFLALALVLGSIAGCSPTGDVTASSPAMEPTQQLPAEPSPALPDGPASVPEPSQDTPTSGTAPAQSTPSPAPTAAQPSEGTPGNKFYAVLTGSEPFYSTDTNQNLTINELGQVVSADSGIAVKVLKFTSADLDGSGMPEAVLWLQVNEDDAYGFEILRQQNGQIYGYTLPYRAFMDLKLDGTFSFSSGAADSGFGSISFSDKAYTINETTYSQSAYGANNELNISYFVNGQAASEAEYMAAVEKQNEKENVSWYDFTDENIASSLIALWRDEEQPSGSPAQSAFPEIILSEESLNIPVPDFLDTDQQLLYRQAFEIYTSLFGGDTSGVCMGDEDKFPDMAETVERNGIPYTKATGRYAVWADFDAMIHSVFTDNFWTERNAGTVFINIDGALYFLNAANGHYYRNYNFPDTFVLNAQSDDEIIFTLTGYYTSPWPNEGETSEQRNQRWENGWEYTFDFTIKLVRTADGWRFDEFHGTAADEVDPPET